MTAARWSLMTLAVASPVSPADASQECLTCASSTTMADVSLGTVAVQSSESQCQEPVQWQCHRLAADTVDSPSPHRTRNVV